MKTLYVPALVSKAAKIGPVFKKIQYPRRRHQRPHFHTDSVSDHHWVQGHQDRPVFEKTQYVTINVSKAATNGLILV